jgi:hypothetical protein
VIFLLHHLDTNWIRLIDRFGEGENLRSLKRQRHEGLGLLGFPMAT